MSTAEYASALNAHYGREGLAERLLEAVRATGKDPARLEPLDLAAVDHFHLRGRDATLELARLTQLRTDQEVLDVGGGLGGPARTLASELGCRVTVLDLTEEFCRAGEVLTARTGLADRVRFQIGDALDLPFERASFDVVWTQHSSMNVPDKAQLYAEIARVLRPRGRFAMHEVVAGPKQPARYPTPWASDPSLSFLCPAPEVRELVGSAGFRELAWHDMTRPSLAWLRERLAASASGVAPPLGAHLLLGEGARACFENLRTNFEEERVAVIEAVFEREA